MKKSFILHIDSLDILDELDKDQIAELFVAMRDYNKWCEVNLSWLMKAIFINFKNQFDRDLQKYEKICERNKSNWIKWWKPKDPQKNPNKPTGVESHPVTPDNDSDNDSDSDSGSKNDSEKDSISSMGGEPPTEKLERVDNFIETQRKIIPWLEYQIQTQWYNKYMDCQYDEWRLLLNNAKKMNVDENVLYAVLDFIIKDDFRKDNIGSIKKLRSKNKDWVPYWVVIIGKIKQEWSKKPVVARFS